MGANVGTGATIGFGTSTFSGLIRKINGRDFSRPSVKTSHLASSVWDSFMPGDLTDPGGVELELLFDPTAAATRPTIGAAETITVNFPLESGSSVNSKVACSGFIESWGYEVPLEELMTAKVVIKFTGTPTWTNQS